MVQILCSTFDSNRRTGSGESKFYQKWALLLIIMQGKCD